MTQHPPTRFWTSRGRPRGAIALEITRRRASGTATQLFVDCLTFEPALKTHFSRRMTDRRLGFEIGVCDVWGTCWKSSCVAVPPQGEKVRTAPAA